MKTIGGEKKRLFFPHQGLYLIIRQETFELILNTLQSAIFDLETTLHIVWEYMIIHHKSFTINIMSKPQTSTISSNVFCILQTLNAIVIELFFKNIQCHLGPGAWPQWPRTHWGRGQKAKSGPEPKIKSRPWLRWGRGQKIMSNPWPR